MDEFSRYMLFYYHDYEAIGGIHDCRFSSDDITDCYEKLLEISYKDVIVYEQYDNYHIFDRELGDLIEEQDIYEQYLLRRETEDE